MFVGVFVLGFVMMYGNKRANAMNLEMTPRLSVDGTYTNNTAGVAGQREGDFQVVIHPSISLRSSFPRGESSLDYGFTMRAYSGNQRLAQDIAHNVGFAYQYQWTPRFSMSLNDRLSLSSDSTLTYSADFKKQVGAILIPERDVLNDSAGIEFSYEITAVSRSNVGYARTVTRYKDPALVDVAGDSIFLRYQNQLSQNGELVVSYRFLNTAVGIENFHTNAVEAGYTVTARPTLVVDVNSGLSYSDGDNRSHLLYKIGLARELKKGTYRVSAGRSFDAIGGLLSGIVVTDTYTVSATWLIRENVGLSFIKVFSKSTQRTDTSTRVDTSTTRGDLGYRISSNVSCGISYDYIDQQANNVTAGTFYVHRVTLFLTWEGTPWR